MTSSENIPSFTLTREQVRELDYRAIHGFGVPGVVLMENAGRGCAELLMTLNPSRKAVVILSGPGNNGGDGFVMARHLDNRGWPVSVHVFAKNNETAHDADVYFDLLFTAGIPFTQYHPDYFDSRQQELFLKNAMSREAWIVDALFGTGLSRPFSHPFHWLVDRVNNSGFPVLAVDLPSGLDCNSGEPLGHTIKAAHTATFIAWKRGFLNPQSREWTGEIHTVDIGAPRKLIEEYKQNHESNESHE